MNYQQLAEIIRFHTELVTEEEMENYLFTEQQSQQLHNAMRKQVVQTQGLAIHLVRVATALAKAKGVNSGLMPQDCWDKALLILQENTAN